MQTNEFVSFKDCSKTRKGMCEALRGGANEDPRQSERGLMQNLRPAFVSLDCSV